MALSNPSRIPCNYTPELSLAHVAKKGRPAVRSPLTLRNRRPINRKIIELLRSRVIDWNDLD
jgi:hypothetical protein